MKQLLNNHKTLIVIIVAVLVILIGIYLWGKKAGKMKAEGPKLDIPKGNNSIPSGWNPKPIAEDLYEAMDGVFTLSGTKDEVFKRAYDLPTDDMLRAVYNAFNELYFNKQKGTLLKWIKDENYYDVLSGYRDMLIGRLEKLGAT